MLLFYFTRNSPFLLEALSARKDVSFARQRFGSGLDNLLTAHLFQLFDLLNHRLKPLLIFWCLAARSITSGKYLSKYMTFNIKSRIFSF